MRKTMGSPLKPSGLQRQQNEPFQSSIQARPDRLGADVRRSVKRAETDASDAVARSTQNTAEIDGVEFGGSPFAPTHGMGQGASVYGKPTGEAGIYMLVCTRTEVGDVWNNEYEWKLAYKHECGESPES